MIVSLHCQSVWTCQKYISNPAMVAFSDTQIHCVGHTWPLARGQQFVTCTVTVHVAKCEWRKSFVFVVVVKCQRKIESYHKNMIFQSDNDVDQILAKSCHLNPIVICHLKLFLKKIKKLIKDWNIIRSAYRLSDPNFFSCAKFTPYTPPCMVSSLE